MNPPAPNTNAAFAIILPHAIRNLSSAQFDKQFAQSYQSRARNTWSANISSAATQPSTSPGSVWK